MGQDIYLRAEDQKMLFPKEYYSFGNTERRKHRLSRIFCNFMCRRETSGGEPELDQIGRITSVDVQPLYEMESNDNNDYGADIETLLAILKTERERQLYLEQMKQRAEKMKENIDKVLKTINGLIDKLSLIENLPQQLNSYGWDSIGYDEYFIDFNIDKGDMHPNFGQDLRNFKRFLEYAKDKGATTVYLQYG
jgi:hypothetical protein